MAMNSPNSRPHINRSSMQFSTFPPRCNSTKSKTAKNSSQGSYTNIDITKSKSWSGYNKMSASSMLKGVPRNTDKFHRSGQSSPSHLNILDTDSTTTGSETSLNVMSRPLHINKWWFSEGSQVQRLHHEWAVIDHCRSLKRSSEMVQHRMNPMYCMSGSNVPLLERYHVDEAELERLTKLSDAIRNQQDKLKRVKYPHGTRLGTSRNIISQERKISSPAEASNIAQTTSEENRTDDNPEQKLTADPVVMDAPSEAVKPYSPVGSPDVTPRPAEQTIKQEESNIDAYRASDRANQVDEDNTDTWMEDGDHEGDRT